jgi:two-component system phosphate regulon sensor histidine kinase PhoR
VEVFRGLAEPIVAVDAYGKIVLTNDSFLELFGLLREDAEQKPADKVIACPPLLEALEALRRRKSSATRTTEACIPDEDGRSRWFRVTCRPISSIATAADESQSGSVAVLADITSQKLVQQRNAEFVAAVSHEMKTPLSSIKAYVELLADGEAEDEATREEFLGVINGQTDRLKRLIDNLLNLARIEAGVVAVNKESQSLNQILQEAVEVLRPAAEQKKITLVAELSPLYLGVLADRDTLLQAIINLLSNAVKYTRESGTVTLRSRASESSVEFEVQDTGVGLSEEDTHKVFEKFYRVKKDKDMAAGTGLGLPLVKHIVEDIHRGQIAVRSTLGEGSAFSVVLPQVRSATH